MSKKTKAPAKPSGRYLLNPATGRVFTWTPMLAERRDLAECSADGVPLRPVAVRVARDATLRKQQEDAALAALRAQTMPMSTPDTFGAPANPAAPVDNSDLGAVEE